MLDDRNDINRDLGYGVGRDEMGMPRDDASWAPLAILALFVVIGGLLWFNGPSENTQTAANNPRIERTMPAPAPAAPRAVTPAPAPQATPPAGPAE